MKQIKKYETKHAIKFDKNKNAKKKKLKIEIKKNNLDLDFHQIDFVLFRYNEISDFIVLTLLFFCFFIAEWYFILIKRITYLVEAEQNKKIQIKIKNNFKLDFHQIDFILFKHQ